MPIDAQLTSRGGYALIRRIAWMGMVWVLSGSLLASATSAPAQPVTAEAAQQMLRTRGVGKLVKVQEADGTQIRGKILGFDESSVRIQSGSRSTAVSYQKIVAVKEPGLSHGARIGLVIVAIMVALGIVGTRV